jgi:hypothetical protein
VGGQRREPLPTRLTPGATGGSDVTLQFSALMELNMLAMENTFHQALYHTREEVF